MLYPKGNIVILGATLTQIFSANGDHEDSTSYATLRGNYAQFLARAAKYYGSRPARVRAQRDDDGPRWQQRFSFNRDGMLLGARIAKGPGNQFTVCCRYEG